MHFSLLCSANLEMNFQVIDWNGLDSLTDKTLISLPSTPNRQFVHELTGLASCWCQLLKLHIHQDATRQ